jgi:hypothetical protein
MAWRWVVGRAAGGKKGIEFCLAIARRRRIFNVIIIKTIIIVLIEGILRFIDRKISAARNVVATEFFLRIRAEIPEVVARSLVSGAAAAEVILQIIGERLTVSDCNCNGRSISKLPLEVP